MIISLYFNRAKMLDSKYWIFKQQTKKAA